MAIILISLLAIFVLVASKNHTAFVFWLLLNLYFDPGGYQGVLFQGNIVVNLNFTDVIFILLWIPYFHLGNNLKNLKGDKYFVLFTKYMSIYMLFFVFVYGFIIPQISGRSDFITFLIKSRTYFMAVLLLRPIYVFIKYGVQTNIQILIYIAAICLSLYFISLLTGLNLIPIATVDRYKDSGIMRITLWSYGIFDWVLNLAVITLLLKSNIKNKRMLLYSGLLMAFSIVLTLTRRELVGRVYSVMIILILITYLFKSQRKIRIINILAPLVILLVLIYITFPQYIGYANNEYKSIGSLVSTGHDKEGGEDYRLAGTGDVVLMKKLIKDNLLFGIGFTRYSYDDLSNFRDLNNPLAGLYAGGELPYLGSLGKMGIIGVMLFLPMYFLMLRMGLKLFNILRLNNTKQFLERNGYVLLLVVFSLTYTISKFTFNLFNIFVETYNPTSFLVFGIILSIMIVCYNDLNKTLQQKEIGNNFIS
jgi:hypothetical protein